VRLDPSTPGDYVRARVLVPRNPGVTWEPTLPPPTLADPLLPLCFAATPSCPSFGHRPSLSFSPQVLAVAHHTSLAPISSSPRCNPSPLLSPSCWCNLQLEFWWEEEGRRKGRTQVDLVVIFLFVLQFIWSSVHLCDSVDMLSRIFVGGRTTVVLVVSVNFAGLISGNHYENHVEICHIFPRSTYVFDSEVYFRRYCILNSARLLSKN
jgi:hypothetical protein